MNNAPLTASCIISNDIGQVLLLQRPDSEWELPTAIVAPTEEPKDTAERAVLETTKLTGTATSYSGAIIDDDTRDPIRQHVYLFSTATEKLPHATQHDEYGWFHADNLPGVSPHLAVFLRDHGPTRPHLPRAQWLATTAKSWTCTAAILTSPDGRLLFVKAAGAAHWGFAGGMIDAHENGPDAAARELHEETGLSLHPGQLLVVTWQHPEPGLDHTIIQFFYDFGTINPDSVTLTCNDGEIVDWQWIHPDELDSATGPGRAQLARQALQARSTQQTITLTTPGLSAHSTHSRALKPSPQIRTYPT